ncbi:hypothetical protein AQUCO_03200068v1 [Aquilegia coerulea]|uniref:BAG domain-containing protein n=1 Tax=Aquilegia coerulea TaxID=218851 RepID=A0A2G5CZZ8_AQUCA|nr:hypothetical protein AQUCO_03200068v1 [Aquilegia coerulea]
MDQQPQTSHIPYLPNNYYPNWEVNPQLKPDSIASYGPWSYGTGVGYPNSMECLGCCSHMYPPGYYTVRPPHSHLPAPCPFYYHEPYTPYAPHLYPPMQQPRYEYHKDMLERHCCGCPNHVFDKKEDKGVKIEEYEPEICKKDSADLLASAKGQSNWQYPFVMLPPEYLKKNGVLKSLEEIDPKVLKGWYPFGMENDSESGKPSGSLSKNRLFLPEVKDVKSLQPVGNEKATQNPSIEDKRAQFPFPVFWFPNYGKLEDQKNKDGNKLDTNTSPKLMEEQPEKLKTIPVNFSGNDNHGTTPVEGKSGNQGVEKKAEKDVKVKNIPVLQVEDRGEKNAVESKNTCKNVHVEQKEESEKKYSGNYVKSRSASPRKASKLPPVCLRVDPLPRRKTGKGTSRSPSPPAGKSEAKQDISTGMQPTIESKGCPGQVGQNMPQSKITVPDASNNETSLISSSSDERDLCKKENASECDGETITVMKIMEESKEKKELSTTEAALLIQALYRGFEVRKWKPLEKLKLIAKVREQANAVRKQIHVLESSTELRNDEKQRVLVGETIMSLLLQLDTIQGLHPNVRDIRKSVARELVSIQERLDSLVKESRGGEKNPEPRNTGEASLPDVHCETEMQNGCVPAEPTDLPKEAEDPATVEKQLPAVERLEESIVAPSDSKFEKISHSTPTEDEGRRLEDRGDAEKLDETLALHVEFAKTPMTTDKKGDSEMKELPELLTQKELCQSQGEVSAEGKQSFDVHNAPSITTENKENLLGKDEDTIKQDDVYENSSLEDCTSLSTVDGSAPLDSKDQELGLGKDKDDVSSQGQPAVCPSAQEKSSLEDCTSLSTVDGSAPLDSKDQELGLGKDKDDVSSQGQPAVCPSAQEKRVEEATALHENNVNSYDEDVFSEPSNLPGIVLLSQETMERSDDENEDDGSNSPQEGSMVPDVVPSLSERVEDLCLGMKSDHTEEDCRELKATADVQEVPVNEEVAVKHLERGGAEDKTLKEENEKLREMIDKLIQEGKQQLTVISDLNGKVKNLERKLTKKKKLRMRGHRGLPKDVRCVV